ncbi:HET-domain-containing protein [Stipitochalara longipes BDJ]|nr:HET-domain-containing protein [Stipitochalara longipes BDJ]
MSTMGKKRARSREDLYDEAGIVLSSTDSEKPLRNPKKQKASPQISRSTTGHSQTGGKKQTRKSKTAGSDSGEPDGARLPDEEPEASQAVDMSIIHGLSNPGTTIKTARKFPYRQLNAGFLEIRVLTLMPGLKAEPIVCEVEHVRADRISNNSEEGYSALSYTWGSPDATGVLHLQGVPIQVRQNLLQALYHLRSPKNPRRLWVDAICINQNDIRERSEQVSIMGKIYQLANEVVVWLGPEKENSKIAIDFITSHVGIRGKSLLSDLSVNPGHATPFQAILDLTKRDYWQRAWIIQEVFQARKINIHCGYDTLPWPLFAKFFRLVEQRVDHFSSAGNVKEICSTTAYRLTRDRTLKNRDLYHLLQRYQDSMCSDPRDRVFSLCGMSNDYKEFVDYSKSPEDLYELLCGFGNYVPMAWHRVRMSQVIQEALDLSTWDRWVEEGFIPIGPPAYNTKPRPDASFICRYSHHNIVANISPQFPMSEETFDTWYRNFQGPNMPPLESVKKALRDLTVQDLRLLNMMESADREPVLEVDTIILS